MNFDQALKHNEKIGAKINELQGKLVSRYRVRVVERSDNDRRNMIINELTDYVTESTTKQTYNNYRALYPETNKYFILIEPEEEVRRVVNVREPKRTDADRVGDSSISDKGLPDIPEEFGETINAI